MYAWHFTEMPYPNLPPLEQLSTMRVSIPSKLYDPRIGADLYNRYLDEHMLADELGLNMLLNEHHQTATCINACAPLTAAILARQTSKGRICILGNPIANRGDPIRIAEEMAMIDCISRGRLDVGFVRGVPYEVFAANSNPTQTVERLWEGIDLVSKAWTHTRRPLQLRRPVHPQARHQPVAAPLPDAASRDLDHRLERSREHQARGLPRLRVRHLPAAAREGEVDVRRLPQRLQSTRACPAAAARPTCRSSTPPTRTRKRKRARSELCWYLDAKSEPQYRNPPGYVPVEFNVQALQGHVHRPHRRDAQAVHRVTSGSRAC